MPRVRYQVAASLDGYIAGPNGEADWIPMDPDIDFAALWRQFDTLLMGRRTYEALARQGGPGTSSGQKIVVVGQTQIRLSDVQRFRTMFGLSANDPQIVRVPNTQDPGISQDDLGDADSGEVRGNQIIIRLSVDKLAAPTALGFSPVGQTSTATEALSQVGVGLLFAADTANGTDFKVE